MRLLPPTAVAVCVAVVLAAPGVAAADEVRDGQWHLTALDLATAHEISTGEGAVIGLVDSGVDQQHPDVADAVVPGSALSGSIDPLSDPVGTGTAMASLMAGRGHGDNGADGVLGIAPAAQVMPAGVVDTSIGGGQYVAEAVQFLIDSGVDIIALTVVHPHNDATQQAIRAAAEASIPVVVPAGSVKGGFYTEVVTAVGTGRSGEHVEGNPSDDLTVGAPSQDLPVAVPGGTYETMNSTALAASIVAGTMALVKANQPELTGPALIQHVLANGTSPAAEGEEELLGSGLIDPVAALSVGGGRDQLGSADDDPDEATAGGDTGPDNTLLVIAVAGVGLLIQVALLAYSRVAGRRPSAV